MTLSRFLLLLAASAALGLGAAAVAEEAFPTLGTIERLDPGFDKLIPPAVKLELLESNKFEWSEGPVWVPDGKYLLFSDIPRNQIWKWKDGEGLSVFLKPAGYSGSAPFTGREPGSNGLLLDKEGRLILCQHGDRRVARREKDGTIKTLADRYQGKRFNSPNDGCFAANGDLYFTDPPYGLPKQMQDPGKELDFQGIYKLTPGGELTLLTKEMTRPNGIALSPDDKTLYVANSDAPPRAVIMAFDVKPDGTVGNGRTFFDASPLARAGKKGAPDGMKVDRAGNLFATGPGGVLVLTPDGKHLGTIATGVPTANCGWGDDGTVLYVTADKNLCRIKTATKGKGF
jgi:gluconolactonase